MPFLFVTFGCCVFGSMFLVLVRAHCRRFCGSFSHSRLALHFTRSIGIEYIHEPLRIDRAVESSNRRQKISNGSTSRVVDRAMSVGLRALLRSPCRDHPHAPSIYLVCDRRFLSVAESDVKNCRTSSYLAGRGALGSIARIVSSSSL